MDVNYLYFVDFVKSLNLAPTSKVLDYGCGNGAVVALLRRSGIEAFGCEVFYEGGSHHSGTAGDELSRLMASGHVVRVKETGDLPWPPSTFELIIANQVFEHVRDLTPTLERMRRVLSPKGVVLLHFPTADVWREGHIGIPFVHWFRPTSRLRRSYTLLLRRLGLGYHKRSETSAVWTDRVLKWLDTYTFYRPYSQVRKALERDWDVRHNEFQYIKFRVARRPGPIRFITALTPLKPLYSLIFRKLAFNAFLLTPRHSADAHSSKRERQHDS